MSLYYCEICGNRVRATKTMKDNYESRKDPVIICQSCRYNLRVPDELKCTRMTKVGHRCGGILFDRTITKCAGCRRRGYE
jgi:hypothetical protein